MVRECASRFSILAAVLLWLCGVLPAHALQAPLPGEIPISPVKTRVGDFSKVAAGRLSLRDELSPANTPDFWVCGYKTASGRRVWKLYGPDLNGVYGGMNGAGGLEGVSPYLNTFNPVINDARGNVLAEVTNGVAQWTLARPTGYGSVPGYRPVAYGNGVDFAKSTAWRGHEVDVTGYYHLGLRDYDPVSGQWLSYDPMWNAGDPNGQSFCAGDPINGFDPNGKCSENAPQSVTMTTPTPLPIFNSDQPPNLFGVQPLNGSSLSPSLENQNAFGFNYETASATLNVGGIAQFGGEFGSGAASIGINNASGEISLYTHFYGNQSTTAYMFSDIAHYGGYPLAVASVYLDYRNPSVSRTQFGINTGVAGIGIFGGPVGASFSVAYGAGSLVQEGVNGAAAGSFQYLTDLYYNAPLGPNYADMPDEP